jgi:hypothetical protein
MLIKMFLKTIKLLEGNKEYRTDFGIDEILYRTQNYF